MLTVTFLGTAAVLPETDGDTICHVINDRILVDTGWNAALRLPRFGIDPLGLTHLLFTHFHHDHYLGLPQFLFQRALLASKQPGVPPLLIGGPAEELEHILERTRHFLQIERFPEVIGVPELLLLHPGDQITVGNLAITVGVSQHSVPSLSYRIEDLETGATVGVTGDTGPVPEFTTFLRGVDLLITEASFGPRPAPANNPYCHLGAPDAAQMAMDAGAKRLALTHVGAEKREATLAAARSLFPNSFWPQDGERVVVG